MFFLATALMSNASALCPQLLTLIETLPTVSLTHYLNPQALTWETHLVADLDLTGDDAFAFMARYAEPFGVQRWDDDPSAYFEPEGLCLLLPGGGR